MNAVRAFSLYMLSAAVARLAICLLSLARGRVKAVNVVALMIQAAEAICARADFYNEKRRA